MSTCVGVWVGCVGGLYGWVGEYVCVCVFGWVVCVFVCACVWVIVCVFVFVSV